MNRRREKQRAVSALEIALAACKAILPTPARPGPDLKRATMLAKFAVAMTK
jgi:hypothetical protein